MCILLSDIQWNMCGSVKDLYCKLKHVLQNKIGSIVLLLSAPRFQLKIHPLLLCEN